MGPLTKGHQTEVRPFSKNESKMRLRSGCGSQAVALKVTLNVWGRERKSKWTEESEARSSQRVQKGSGTVECVSGKRAHVSPRSYLPSVSASTMSAARCTVLSRSWRAGR